METQNQMTPVQNQSQQSSGTEQKAQTSENLQSSSQVLTSEQVAESSRKIKEEIADGLEKKKRGRPRKNFSDAPASSASKPIQSSNIATIQKPLAPPIDLETLSTWQKSGFDLLAEMRKCDAYKLPDDVSMELAKHTQVILQHLGASVNPLHAAIGSAVLIIGMHSYSAYKIEVLKKEEKTRQENAS
jgi:hypothetical protein